MRHNGAAASRVSVDVSAQRAVRRRIDDQPSGLSSAAQQPGAPQPGTARGYAQSGATLQPPTGLRAPDANRHLRGAADTGVAGPWASAGAAGHRDRFGSGMRDVLADPQADPPPPPRTRPQIFMAASYQGATLGVAVYDALASEISLLQCQDEVQGPLAFQMLQLAKMQVEPQVLVLSSTAGADALEAARAPWSSVMGDGGDTVTSAGGSGGFGSGARGPEVRLERSVTFTYDKGSCAMQAVCQLGQLCVRISDARESPAPANEALSGAAAGSAAGVGPSHVRGQAAPTQMGAPGWPPAAAAAPRQPLIRRVLQVAGLVDLSQRQAVGALGALVAFMLKEGLGPQADAGEGIGQDSQLDLDPDLDVGPGGGGTQGQGAGRPAAGQGPLVVDRVNQLAIQGLLRVDLPTLYGLQILASERHPSAMGLGKPKEGFSLFNLANRCVTAMGKKMLRLWFLRPLVNLDLIRDRQDTLELLLRNGGELIAPFQGELRRLPDMASLLRRLALSQLRPDVKALQQLQTCLQQLLRLRAVFEHQLAPQLAGLAHEHMPGAGLRWDKVAISCKLLEHVGPELQTALDTLLSIVDTNQAEEDMVIAAGVCPELDQLKATARALPDYLNRVLQSELERVPRYLRRQNSAQLWTVVYLPQVGFMMQVQGQRLTEDVLDTLPDYEFAFEGTADVAAPAAPAASETVTHGSAAASGGGGGANWVAYYRTQATNELNARFGDIQYNIRDLETSLVAEMVGRLLHTYGARLQRAAQVMGELDCLVALAALAAAGGPGGAPYCRPQLTTDNVLHIYNGRHPLAETVVDRYIPFTTSMHGDHDRLQIITGPNASGKSCYARAVALIVFLAHLGSYVPADSATVGLTDRIFARSAALGAVPRVGGLGGLGAAGGGGGGGGVVRPSTFMADLAQVSSMLYGATSRSLLILDEFGKGTLASDGVGLTAAILNHFATGMTETAPDPSAAAATSSGTAEFRAAAASPSAEQSVSVSATSQTKGHRSGNQQPQVVGAGAEDDPRVGAVPQSPRLILCTHFHELFREGVLVDSPQLAFLQMEVLTGAPAQPQQPQHQQHQRPHAPTRGSGATADAASIRQRTQERHHQQQQEEQDEEHVFLYRLVPGQCPASFGVHCARLAGLDEAVCRRAREIIAAQQSGGVVSRAPRVLASQRVQHDLRVLRQLQECASLPSEQERDAALLGIIQREREEAEAATAAAGRLQA